MTSMLLVIVTVYRNQFKYCYLKNEIFHCMKNRIFVLRKFVTRKWKIIFSLVFVSCHFGEISYFLNVSSNENVRKQHLSANEYFCVNMKFSYTMAGSNDEILYVVLQWRPANVYIFYMIISCRKSNILNEKSQILFLFSFMVIKALSFSPKNVGIKYNRLTLNMVFLF